VVEEKTEVKEEYSNEGGRGEFVQDAKSCFIGIHGVCEASINTIFVWKSKWIRNFC
jgi:hypothetical protein